MVMIAIKIILGERQTFIERDWLLNVRKKPMNRILMDSAPFKKQKRRKEEENANEH